MAGAYLMGRSDERAGRPFSLANPAQAADQAAAIGSNSIVPDRYVYYPGTEVLAEKEVRVIACGTGMPDQRIAQASACFLFEFGNGEKLIFDLGTGSMRNLASLMIPYEYLDKIIISHLHTDHWGELGALWAGGWTSGRPGPLQIWGPSGQTEEMGTAYAVAGFLQANNWDYQTRAYKITPLPGQIETHEFDYLAENKVCYDEKGVVVRHWPAIHAGDGPVSFSIEYAGMKIVFGGDTVPNKWFAKYAKDADFIIHECMLTADQLMKFYNQPPALALAMNTDFHTSAQACGKVFSMMKPRHAVAYHFFNEEGTRYGIYEGIRETYDGPLSMATDLMVWNITKDKITERMAVATHEAWSVPGDAVQPPPEKGRAPVMTKAISSGRLDVSAVGKKMIDDFMKKT